MSQLSKPILEVLSSASNSHPQASSSASSSLLDCFTQFMESVDALSLVQFWLSVEAFKSTDAALSTSCTYNPNSLSPSGIEPQGLVGIEAHQDGAECDSRSCAVASGSKTASSLSSHVPERSFHEQKFIDSLHLGERHCTSRRKESQMDLTSCLSNQLANLPPSPTIPGAGSEGSVLGKKDNSYCVMSTESCSVAEGCGSNPSSGMSVSLLANSTALDKPCGPLPVVQETILPRASHSVSDPMGIYTTYIALNATCPVGVPDTIRQNIEVSICPEDGVVSRSCFNDAQTFVFDLMEKRHYPEFLRSPLLCKYQLEYITSGNLRLIDFLLGQGTLFFFMEYMEQEGASSLLQFWLTAESFHTHMSAPSRIPDIEADTGDAIAIYDRYFSLQATEPLNMGDTVRFNVENKICDESGPRPDSFSIAQQNAYDTMNQTYYPRFLESSIYLRFLDELVHMVQAPGSRRPSTVALSECSTDSADPTFGFDVDDPDLLWQRIPLPMRLGYVDDFGQYISEVEPSPSKSGKLFVTEVSSKRRRFWRKKRIDEEMATKLARAVVVEVLEAVGAYSTAAEHLSKLNSGRLQA